MALKMSARYLHQPALKKNLKKLNIQVSQQANTINSMQFSFKNPSLPKPANEH